MTAFHRTSLAPVVVVVVVVVVWDYSVGDSER
jgi:hypothetical protein